MMEMQASFLEDIGDLGTTPVERVLGFFATQGASGALFMASGIKQKAVELREGSPVAVFSNLDAERLGARLIKAKMISEAQLAAAVQATVSAPNSYLGEQLVAARALPEDGLGDALQAQAEEKLLELLSWKQGHYRFHQGKSLRQATRPPHDVDGGALLRRGARERIPQRRVDAFWEKHDGRQLTVHAPGSDVNWGHGETEVIERIHPSLPVLTLTTWPEEARRIAYGLWLGGILAVAADAAPSNPSSPPVDSGRAARTVLQAPERFRAGRQHLEKRQWPQALAAFEEAFDLDPSAGEYLAHLGWAYYLKHGKDRESLETAFTHVKRAAKLVPHDPTPWVFLGRLYQVVDRLEPAKRMFHEALQRDPHCVDAKRELRILESATSKWRRAFRRALRR